MALRGWRDGARYGVPGLLLGLALAGGFGSGRGPLAQAQAQPGVRAGQERQRAASVPAGESSGTIAFTTNHGASAQLLYLIDTRARAFAVYRVDPANAKGTVKLEATRQYQWDLKLAEYNNLPPEVAAIESTVKTLGQPVR
jgi:hypothetical protein